MKNLFAKLASSEINSSFLSRDYLSLETNSTLKSIFTSVLQSGLGKDGGEASSIHTLVHLSDVQDESPELSQVAEHCLLVFMPHGSDALVENTRNQDHYLSELDNWRQLIPGGTNPANPKLLTLCCQGEFVVFDYEAPSEREYSFDGNIPTSGYAALVFNERVLVIRYANSYRYSKKIFLLMDIL